MSLNYHSKLRLVLMAYWQLNQRMKVECYFFYSSNYSSEYAEATELHKQSGITHFRVSPNGVDNMFVRVAGKVVDCIKRELFV